jgi:predicted SAM-dependent methyltransferase
MALFDVTHLPFPDHCFDAIYASHVLEHVREDRCAMSELARVLKLSGWAILQVPLDTQREATYEDFTITDPQERLKAFGHYDHVRTYGRDYRGRLEDAGFYVEVDDFVRSLPPGAVNRLGLREAEDVYYCTRK